MDRAGWSDNVTYDVNFCICMMGLFTGVLFVFLRLHAVGFFFLEFLVEL